MLCSYEQIYDVLQGYLSQLLYTHTLDIGISAPDERISDGLQEYFYNLTDGHTLDIGISGPYELIVDV